MPLPTTVKPVKPPVLQEIVEPDLVIPEPELELDEPVLTIELDELIDTKESLFNRTKSFLQEIKTPEHENAETISE